VLLFVEVGFDLLGRWSLEGDGPTLVLAASDGSRMSFALVDAETLRQLDRQGRAIESDLPYELARQPEFEFFEPRLEMRGMFQYMADAALFHECATGRKLPVAQEEGYLDLERTYLETRETPGQPILSRRL
jgi:copper homeostasis protein (lipoprotein)